MDSPSSLDAESDVDRAIARITALLGLGIMLGEVVWLIDTHAGSRPSALLCRLRSRRAAAGRWWQRATAPSRARAEAPALVWEAWAAAEEFAP